MTSPLTGDRTRFEPGTLGAATLRSRRRPSPPLFLGRLRRGVRRQWALALLIALLASGAGIAYDLSGGLRPDAAALFWIPIGAAAGLTVALVRELGRNTITSISSFGRNRGYAILGAAPELTLASLRQLPPQHRTPLGALAFQAASPFATAFRDLQSVLDQDDLVAFIAALPGEGATTTALCTAISATQQGRSAIIVDCDVSRRTLTRLLSEDPEYGVLDAAESPNAWRTLIEEEPETGLHFLPAARARNPWRSLVGARGFPALVAALRDSYDLVVLDCPPALSSGDGPIVASFASRTVLVSAWDRTPLNAVRQAMRVLKRAHANVGVYVNRVPPSYRFGRLRGD